MRHVDVPLSCCSALDLAEGCFKYPLVEQYLKTKRFSCSLVVKYMVCQCLTLLVLLLSCGYHCYYIFLASLIDEFPCDVRTGMLKNDSGVPAAVQCKMVAVGVFRLLSYINLGVYLLLTPLVVLAALGPARQSSGFLRAYEILPGFGALGKVKPIYNDLSMYLLFLKENLSELKSFKCLQVSPCHMVIGFVVAVDLFLFYKSFMFPINRCWSCCSSLPMRGSTQCACCKL